MWKESGPMIDQTWGGEGVGSHWQSVSLIVMRRTTLTAYEKLEGGERSKLYPSQVPRGEFGEALKPHPALGHNPVRYA